MNQERNEEDDNVRALFSTFADVVIAFSTDDCVIGNSWVGEEPPGGIHRGRW